MSGSFHLSGLFVYPLKSGAGIALERAELDDFGIRHDRRWMVFSDQAGFLTQREIPRLALIRTSFDNGSLRLDAPGARPLRLPLAGPDGARLSVGVWADQTEAVDTGAESAAWISTLIGGPARIVYMPDDVVRPVDPTFAIGEDRVSFADAFPFLLITQASLDGLNARLDQPLRMNRFRPNLVVAGAAAHAEDTWRTIRIGDVSLAVVKPCARCVTTTVEQETGDTGKEPLRTLATYRKRDSKVYFGQNLIHLDRGELRRGDPVTVVETVAS